MFTAQLLDGDTRFGLFENGNDLLLRNSPIHVRLLMMDEHYKVPVALGKGASIREAILVELEILVEMHLISMLYMRHAHFQSFSNDAVCWANHTKEGYVNFYTVETSNSQET